MKTEVYKSIYGWKAETHIDLGNNRELHFTTMKRSNGVTVTNANVVRVSDGMCSFVVFQDYSEAILSEKLGRVTEKAVREQHQKALLRLEEVKAKVRAHYAAKGFEV